MLQSLRVSANLTSQVKGLVWLVLRVLALVVGSSLRSRSSVSG
ncbi:hypothetical protein [Streptomyces sp. IMTB 2501]|nr:hypothetical protein [Streptomyces sp. IMTB 2501]